MQRYLPEPVRRFARPLARKIYEIGERRTFARAMGRLQRLTPGEVPDRSLLRDLTRGWGNPNFVAHPEYLHELALRCARATGPVLECGSGLTTIVCGMVAGKRAIPTWSLENHARWSKRTAAVLERWNVPNVHLLTVPLKTYEPNFAWYDPPANLPASFDLVVCDGPGRWIDGPDPEGKTAVGRYGLMPVLGEKLPAGTVVLFDDWSLPRVRSAVDKWQSERQLDVQVTQCEPGRAFATITLLS